MKRWLFIFATMMAVLWLVPDAEARGRGGRGGGGRAAAAMVGVAVGAAAAMLAPRNPPPAQVAKPFNCTPIGWCYTVYNPDGSVAESGANPPKIDLSYAPLYIR